jgi:hypothetical protein
MSKTKYERTISAAESVVRSADSEVFTLCVSSEYPYRRGKGLEVLDHGPGSIIMDRLREGAALLFNHDRDMHLGLATNPRIGPDRKLRVDARFGSSKLAREKRQDVVDGVLPWISISYNVLEERPERFGGQSGYRVTKWEPLEVSLVTIPADPSVGVGRSFAPLTPTLDYSRDWASILDVPKQEIVGQLEREQQQHRVKLARLKV